MRCEYTTLLCILRGPWCRVRGDADSAWSLPLLEDTTLLSKPACDTSHGVQERPKHCQEMEKSFLHLAQGPPCPLPSNPMKQQQGLRQVHLTPWEQGRGGAGQEDSWLSLCIRAHAEHKRRDPRAWRRQSGDHGDPEGQPLPGTVVTVATAAGTSAALGQCPGPQLQGGRASCCGSAQREVLRSLSLPPPGARPAS